jgi:hypothetical protein
LRSAPGQKSARAPLITAGARNLIRAAVHP